MSKRRRPFKAHAKGSWAREEWHYSSFATRGAALARATLYLQAGCYDVRVWENDERGYMVPGSGEYLQ